MKPRTKTALKAHGERAFSALSRRVPKPVFSAAVALVALATGCGGSPAGTPTPAVPPAEAYPRPALPAADTLVAVDDTGLAVNPAAKVVTAPTEAPGAKAITVTYPGLGVHIYYTVRPVPAVDMKAAIENRLERMSLNLGGIPARTDHTADDSTLEGILLTARSGSQTPVQLLVAGDGILVSGTAFIDDARATTNYDSIRPLVDMLYDDMSRAVPSATFVKE